MISMKHCRGLFASLLLLFAVCQIAAYARQAAASPLNDAKSTPLREGWEIQTACKVTADGVQLSTEAGDDQTGESASGVRRAG